jgi:hypothetical protein
MENRANTFMFHKFETLFKEIQPLRQLASGDKSPLKTMALIFCTCLLVYALFWGGHQYSIDGIVAFQYAKALLFQHSFQMNPPVVWGEEIFTVSKWPIGQTLLFIPLLAVLSATVFRGQPFQLKIPYKPGVSYLPELMNNAPYRYASLINPLLTAATASLVYLLCIQTGMSKKLAAAAALVFGIASPAAVYAKFDYAQPLASFLILASLILAIHAGRHPHISIIWAAVFLGLAILTRPETVLYATPAILLAAYAVATRGLRGKGRHALYRIGTILVFVLGFILLNQVINSFRFGSISSTGYDPNAGDRFILNAAYILKAISGNLFSPGRGIFLFFPLSLLGILGLWAVWKRDRIMALILGSIPLIALLVYSAWSQWGAGISWGPRFLIPVLPYITVLTFWGYRALGRFPKGLRYSLMGILILMGWIISLQGQLYNFVDFYSSRFLTNEQIVFGDYNFEWENSPLFAGWQGGLSAQGLDNHWFRSISAESVRAFFVVLGMAFLLGGLGWYWISFFIWQPNQNFGQNRIFPQQDC